MLFPRNSANKLVFSLCNTTYSFAKEKISLGRIYNFPSSVHIPREKSKVLYILHTLYMIIIITNKVSNIILGAQIICYIAFSSPAGGCSAAVRWN